MKNSVLIRVTLATSGLLRPLLVGCAFLLASPLVDAQTWDGGGTDNSTLTANNWNPNTVPTGTPTLAFAGATRPSVVWNGINTVAPMNVTAFTFAVGASPFTINSGNQTAIQFVVSTNAIVNSSSNLQTIAPTATVFFNGIKTFDGGTAGLALSAISFRGDSMVSGNTNTLNLIGAGNSTATSISQTGFVAGANTALTKSGTGRWTFSGGATYNGTTTISAGTLEYQGSLSSSGVTNNSALIFNNAATQSYANAIGGTGTLTKQGTGALTLSGANSYQGITTVDAGTLIAGANAPVSANGAFGNAASALLLGSTTGSANAALLTGGAFTVGRTITVRTGSSGIKSIGGNTDNDSTFSGAIGLADNLTVSQVATTSTNTLAITGGLSSSTVGSKTLTFNNVGAVAVNTAAIANGNGTVSVIQSGAGVTTFNAANTYTGTTAVNAGTLRVTGDNSAATGAVTVANTATLGGTGTIGGDTTIQSGGTLSPGNSPGTLTYSNADLILNDGGNLNWQILDANGVAGTGYDTNSVTGTGILDLSALTGGTDFNINLWSLSGIGPDVNGNANNFNNALNFTWTLVSTPTAILNFDASDFTINVGAINGTGGFSNTTNGTFSVALADSNTDLVLTYTAVPEPATFALLAGGVIGLVALRRRMRA